MFGFFKKKASAETKKEPLLDVAAYVERAVKLAVLEEQEKMASKWKKVHEEGERLAKAQREFHETKAVFALSVIETHATNNTSHMLRMHNSEPNIFIPAGARRGGFRPY